MLLLTILVAGSVVACSVGGGSSGKRINRELLELRSLQSEQVASLNALEARVGKLEGRIEELEFFLNKKLGEEVHNLRAKVSQLGQRVPPPPIVPEGTLAVDEALAKNLGGDYREMFEQALKFLRSGEFTKALPLLRDLTIVSEGEYWNINARFWLGVCYEALGMNTKALGVYHEIVSKYPKHNRTPLVLLREASVFIRLKDSPTARLTLLKLIKEYPETKEAKLAREKIKDLSSSNNKSR